MVRNIGFRSWYYFRMGYSSYFAFVFGVIAFSIVSGNTFSVLISTSTKTGFAPTF